MTDIFVSYAHEDREFVERILPHLRAAGFSVWWDHTIPPGQSWDSFILRGIQEAKATIVIWSPNSVRSDWVKEEATAARGSGKYIPVQIGGAAPPIGFQRVQAAQLEGWDGDTNHPQWRLLIGAIESLMEGQSLPVTGAPGQRRHSSSSYTSPKKESSTLGKAAMAFSAMVLVGVAVLTTLHFTGDLRPMLANFVGAEAENVSASDVVIDAEPAPSIEAVEREESKELAALREDLQKVVAGQDDLLRRAEAAERKAEDTAAKLEAAERRADDADARIRTAENRAASAERRAQSAEQKAREASAKPVVTQPTTTSSDAWALGTWELSYGGSNSLKKTTGTVEITRSGSSGFKAVVTKNLSADVTSWAINSGTAQVDGNLVRMKMTKEVDSSTSNYWTLGEYTLRRDGSKLIGKVKLGSNSTKYDVELTK